MKTKMLSNEKEIEIPELFMHKIREDLAQKYYETSKKQQPHGPDTLAGKKHSASGKLSHRRRKWKTTYGHGMSRVPRKIFWRRGTQFYWVGAFISNTRGGRRPHAPQVEHFLKSKKINKKEVILALRSLFASTASQNYVTKRYSTLKDKKITHTLPLIIDESTLKLKTKEFIKFLMENLKEFSEVIMKKKRVRAGKGKIRNRKYKSNAGMLLIIGKDEEKRISGIEVRSLEDLEISDLFPLGRLTVYTEKAIEEIKNIIEQTGTKGEKK